MSRFDEIGAEINVDTQFLYCKDKKYQYILHAETGKEIYKREYTSYSESCFCFCGNTERGPVFYDARYSTYIYPENGSYKVHKDIFNTPLVVNDRNILNIMQGDNGIGVIDSCGNTVVDNKYDFIKVELKITAQKGKETEEKIFLFLGIYPRVKQKAREKGKDIPN